MNVHERFNLALSHNLPDRLPVDLIWPRIETVDQLKQHFKVDSEEEIYRRLEIDFRWIPIPAEYPEFNKKVNGRLEGEAPGAGQEYIFHDGQTFEDHWGVVHRVGDDGKYLEWKGGPLQGKENLEEWTVPEVIYPSVDEIAENIMPSKNYITITEIEFPFKIAWHLCGYEQFLMDMVLKPEMVNGLYNALYKFQTEKAMLAARAGYDVIALVGDIAGQEGMMYSPAVFGELEVPRLKNFISTVKKTNPELKVLYHSDGDITAVIIQLIDCGVDILNPIQSACMNPEEVKKKYGESLTFHGTISVQDTIPNGTVKDVKEEVIKRIQTVGYNGGLIISPENSIPYDAPLENILAIYDAVFEFHYSTLL